MKYNTIGDVQCSRPLEYYMYVFLLCVHDPRLRGESHSDDFPRSCSGKGLFNYFVFLGGITTL